MFRKTFHATHPVMMDKAANDDLRARYLAQGLFADGEINLDYSHNERFVIGGAVPKGAAIRLPDQAEPASAKGHPFLERREMAAVNIGGPGAIAVSSNPTSDRSRGTSISRWRAACSAPAAISSLLAKIAVGRGLTSSSRSAAARPVSKV